MVRALAALLSLLALAGPAAAAEWGGIEPGASTTQSVRQRYGPATSESAVKVEGYDTQQWVYEGDKAPTGLIRMTVEFGLLTPSGYKPTVVRLLKLEPRPFIFGRGTIVQGWGVPDGVGNQDGLVTAFYREGLFVVFDKEGQTAVTMIFTIPQPDAPAPKPAPGTKP
jgi:hypothetical protein